MSEAKIIHKDIEINRESFVEYYSENPFSPNLMLAKILEENGRKDLVEIGAKFHLRDDSVPTIPIIVSWEGKKELNKLRTTPEFTALLDTYNNYASSAPDLSECNWDQFAKDSISVWFWDRKAKNAREVAKRGNKRIAEDTVRLLDDPLEYFKGLPDPEVNLPIAIAARQEGMHAEKAIAERYDEVAEKAEDEVKALLVKPGVHIPTPGFIRTLIKDIAVKKRVISAS